jgi:hypothetical protein
MVPKAEVFKEMDKRDEQQALADIGALDAALLKEMVYEVHGQVQLSWAGVKECARRMGSIRLVDPTIQEDDEKYTVIVKAVDDENHLEFWGVATQRKVMDTRRGQVPDDYALQKALSKAQRNATRAVIPEAMLQVMIQSFVDAKRGKKKTPDTRSVAVSGVVVEEERDTYTDDQIEAALHTIKEFIREKPDENRDLVGAMLATKEIDINEIPPDQIPPDVLAFVVTEINKMNNIETTFEQGTLL